MKEQEWEVAREFAGIKARGLVGQYGYTENDVEDIEQELLLDLMEHPPKESDNIERSIVQAINDKKRNLIQYRKQKCRDYRRKSISLYDKVDDGDGDGDKTLRHETMGVQDCRQRKGLARSSDQERIALKLDVDDFRSTLSDFDTQLCNLIEDNGLKETANALNVARSTVILHLSKLRPALQLHLTSKKDEFSVGRFSEFRGRGTVEGNQISRPEKGENDAV